VKHEPEKSKPSDLGLLQKSISKDKKTIHI
jgi:hypothetical protein